MDEPFMANRQIEEYRGRDIQPLGQRARTRSLPTQVSAVTLQPVYFFRTLTDLQNTRQWLWIGLFILLLTALSAVRQDSLGANSGAAGGDVGFIDPGLGGGFADPGFGGGIGVPPDFGGPPSDVGAPTGGAGGGDLAATWTTGLIAATKALLSWAVLTVLLCEVSLLNGKAPRFGHNFQIAVWSSIPLGMMAALQLLFYAGGGMPGQPGLTGLVSEIPGYETLPAFFQSVLLSLAGNLTVFWLWSLVLIYFGARIALNGKRWASALVVVIWTVVLVITPVLTGAIAAPTAESGDGMPADFGGEMPFPEATPEGGFVFDDGVIDLGADGGVIIEGGDGLDGAESGLNVLPIEAPEIILDEPTPTSAGEAEADERPDDEITDESAEGAEAVNP
jgi:hypothetical protein